MIGVEPLRLHSVSGSLVLECQSRVGMGTRWRCCDDCDGSPTDAVLLEETCVAPHSADNVLHGVREVIRENLERYTRAPGGGSVSGDVVSCVAGDTGGRLAVLLHVDRSFIRFYRCSR